MNGMYLYDVHDPNYFDKTKRTLVLKRVLVNDTTDRKLPTTDDITTKMNGLRTYYNYERPSNLAQVVRRYTNHSGNTENTIDY